MERIMDRRQGKKFSELFKNRHKLQDFYIKY